RSRATALTWDDVRARRLAHQHLVSRAPRERVVDVVRDVCGLQAQVLSAAELGLAARVSGITARDVRDELWVRRRLVKTYGPRGTLHILAADELPLWMAAMRARADARPQPWHEAHGLDAAQASALLEAIGEALDGRCLTREELAAEVARRA